MNKREILLRKIVLYMQAVDIIKIEYEKKIEFYKNQFGYELN